MALGGDSVIELNIRTIIGSGNQGNVYCARRMDTNEILALKTVHVDEQVPEKRAQLLKQLTEQLQRFLEVKHRHLVRHFAHQTITGPHPDIKSMERTTLQILMEFCEGGSLGKYVKTNVVPASLIQKWTQQLVDGLAYLHEQRYVHRDVKGDNIVLSSPDAYSCDLKFTDLGDLKGIMGQSTKANELSKSRGTHPFMSPEMVSESGNVGRRTDIWSLGCVIIQMVTGRPPRFFREREEVLGDAPTMFFVASGGQPAMPAGLPDLLQRFIERCLIRNVDGRPYAPQLLSDPFLLATNAAEWPLPNRKDLWTSHG
ncbi:uncharacterized protein LOC129599306 [Paramacrobiotus metropolitanus]|uniref:uncharacterized protein LOC129599306 n=1 Tax=Paramacrobiotus metropolitanus TaxID=2943436 RepID=UPI002445D212|nr:uncharacterized protein LOC129599306 [Paramacrobiotus metropolitanus]